MSEVAACPRCEQMWLCVDAETARDKAEAHLAEEHTERGSTSHPSDKDGTLEG